MNHQPFETWLLSDEPLEPQDALSLAEHLTTCGHCQQLQLAWSGVMDLFERAPDVEPVPGFANRWHARLAAEKQVDLAMRQRWQSWIVLILVGNAAAMTLVLLGAGLFSSYDSPAEFLIAWIYRLTSTLMAVNWVQNVIGTLARTLPGAIPVSWWVIGVGFLAISSMLWIFSISRLTKISSVSRRA